MFPLLVVSLTVFNSIIFVYLAFYTMRKLYARITWRYGPKYVGPAGFFQVLADILKLMVKEDILPDMEPTYMRWLYGIAPYLLLGLSASIAVVTPISYYTARGPAVEHGLLWVLLLLSLDIVVMITATWYVSSKYSFAGSYRNIGQSLSYEAVESLSLLAPMILAGSTNFLEIAQAQQHVWYVFILPLGFITGVIALMAEIETVPFDVPEAPTEVAGGWTLEYTGPRYLSLFLSERLLGVSLMVVLSMLYLGGNAGYPPLPLGLWIFIKAFLIAILVMLVSAAYPRYSVKRMLEKAWSLWVPLAYLNLVLAIILRILGWW